MNKKIPWMVIVSIILVIVALCYIFVTYVFNEASGL